ncbi:MAG: hypothetical protein IT292_09765 [Deltaproteobacteria bacterium]|nr:hypothetical protein [Deltaproteobacteria bacterium]
MKTKLFFIFLSSLFFVSCKCSRGQGGSICGGAGNFPCPSDMYCNLKPPCGGFDVEGFCRLRPLNCPPNISEICGCDNRTYSSACIANSAGVTVKHEGKCPG